LEDERKVAVELGESVRSRREALGLTLEDVNKETKIRKAFLEAIEEGNLKFLSGVIYVKGFIKAYLKVIDAEDLYPEYEKLVDRLAAERETRNLETVVNYMPPQKRFRKPSRWWIYGSAILLLLASGFMVWQEREQIREKSRLMLEREKSQTVESAPLPEEAPASEDGAMPEVVIVEEAPLPQEAEVLEQEAKSEEKEEEEQVPAEEPSETKVLAIEFEGPCWVRITKGNEVVFQGTLRKGDTKEVVVDAPVRIRYGNAGVVANRWDGQTKEKIGQSGEVVTYEYLPDGTMKRM